MGREKRGFERVDSLVSVHYSSRESRIEGNSLTKDVSESGIGLPVDGKIPAGGMLELKIFLEGDHRIEIPAAAKVVWSKRNQEHWKSRYSAGLNFMTIDSSDKKMLIKYARGHRWIKSDFERALEEDRVGVLGGKGEFLP